MNSIRAFFATRVGRLVVHDGALALGAGLSAWEAAGQSLTWGAAVAAGVVAGKAFLRLILPVPASGQLVGVKVRSRKAGTGVAVALPLLAGSVHDRLALLPAPAGRKGGALPSPRDDRDWRAKLPKASTLPASVDYGAGITWGMLLNATLGDCYEAAWLHALQLLTGYQPVDADALAVYEQVTGYDPHRTDANGNNPTDQGTYGRQLFDWARGKGLIASYAAVPTDRASVRAAIFAHKAVLCEWALPVGAETEGDMWTMPRVGRAAGSWGGHATVETGYTTRRNRNVTWGEYGTVTPPFEDAYLQAAWVVTVAPGTNVAAIMAKVRAG